ncbi:MAG: hypothetical protein RL346_1170 [Verrucomicrobiota bacterium]|jgi:hypothetical protein
MKILSICVCCILSIGCAKTSAPLVVKIQTIRDQKIDKGGDPMVMHEKSRRLYGAVSMEERRQRLGQYYTVLWNFEGGAKREILFEYQQGKSGSLVKTIRRELKASTHSGKEEFSVIGDNYFENGRVLCWRVSLIADGKTVSTSQSYLWE